MAIVTLGGPTYVSHPSDPNTDNNRATDSDVVLNRRAYIPLVLLLSRHSREGGNPLSAAAEGPAFAGMTLHSPAFWLGSYALVIK